MVPQGVLADESAAPGDSSAHDHGLGSGGLSLPPEDGEADGPSGPMPERWVVLVWCGCMAYFDIWLG